MDYVAKTKDLLEQVKTKTKIDFNVLKVEWVKEDGINYLRVYCSMDQEGGIGSDDLAKITRPLNKLLDKEDFINEEYTLEVCSPGYLDDVKTNDDYDISLLNDQEEDDHE